LRAGRPGWNIKRISWGVSTTFTVRAWGSRRERLSRQEGSEVRGLRREGIGQARTLLQKSSPTSFHECFHAHFHLIFKKHYTRLLFGSLELGGPHLPACLLTPASPIPGERFIECGAGRVSWSNSLLIQCSRTLGNSPPDRYLSECRTFTASLRPPSVWVSRKKILIVHTGQIYCRKTSRSLDSPSTTLRAKSPGRTDRLFNKRDTLNPLCRL